MKIQVGLFVSLLLSIAVTAPADQTRTDVVERLQSGTTVLHQMMNTPDKGIPDEVLRGAKCIAVVPGLIKGGFIVAGQHGRGIATCRLPKGTWSAPAFFAISGGSWGAQIGGKSTDLVMFIMNDQGMNDLLAGHIKVGADVSAAAGPVGRSASADAGFKAGILTYSASKGAFIGASLNGAELQQDGKATREWYGKDVPFKDILQGNVPIPNEDARAFVSAVQSAKEASTR